MNVELSEAADRIIAELPGIYHDPVALVLLHALYDYSRTIFIFDVGEVVARERSFENARGLYKSIVARGVDCVVYQGTDYALKFRNYKDANPQVTCEFVYPLTKAAVRG